MGKTKKKAPAKKGKQKGTDMSMNLVKKLPTKKEAKKVVENAINGNDEKTETTADMVKRASRSSAISETKLGITLVISRDDCETLGISLNTTTGAAIDDIRQRLGLPTRSELKAERKKNKE